MSKALKCSFIYIVILVYQNTMIETSHRIFLSLFYNYYQKDKFMNVLHTSLTNVFNLLGLTSNTITERQDFRKLIRENAKNFEESYHYYYLAYVDLKMQ